MCHCIAFQAGSLFHKRPEFWKAAIEEWSLLKHWSTHGIHNHHQYLIRFRPQLSQWLRTIFHFLLIQLEGFNCEWSLISSLKLLFKSLNFQGCYYSNYRLDEIWAKEKTHHFLFALNVLTTFNLHSFISVFWFLHLWRCFHLNLHSCSQFPYLLKIDYEYQ